MIIVIGAVAVLGINQKAEAESGCQLVAPESCYRVRGNHDEPWNGSRSSNLESHCHNRPNNSIDLPVVSDNDVCNYMQTKNFGQFTNCSQVDVNSIQNVIKPWLQNNPNIWQNSVNMNGKSWLLRKQEYQTYYTDNKPQPNQSSFSGTLSVNYWPNTNHELYCQRPKSGGITMLDDGMYGYCTRMALQLYLNQDCFTPYIPPPPPKFTIYTWGHDTGDNGSINKTTTEIGNIPLATDPDEQIEMCIGNEKKSVLMFFESTGTPNNIYANPLNETKRVCDWLYEGTTTNYPAGCKMSEVKERTVVLINERDGDNTVSIDKYGTVRTTPEDSDNHKKFKRDLSSLLVKDCTYGELVIGRADDGADLLLEKPSRLKGKSEPIDPGSTSAGDLYNDFGFPADGSIEFCKNDKLYKATMFFDEKGRAIFKEKDSTEPTSPSYYKGAAEYICKEGFKFNTEADCTLTKIKEKLANKVFKDVLPPIKTHTYPNGESRDPFRRKVADYLLIDSDNDFENNLLILESNDGDHDGSEYSSEIESNHNVFKKELSQYLTANCRSNLGEKPEDKDGIEEYTTKSCFTNDLTEKIETYWYDPQDRLLSKNLCEVLNGLFIRLSQNIQKLHASPMAQMPEFSDQIKNFDVPTPPTNFLLDNGSCRLADLQALVADDADYYFFKGNQGEALKDLYQTYEEQYAPQTNYQDIYNLNFALDLLAATAFAQDTVDTATLDHEITDGKLDPEMIKVINNITKSSCPGTCITPGSPPTVSSTPPLQDLKFPHPCPLNKSFKECMKLRFDKTKVCGNDCSPGYIKNHQGVCVSEDFFGWQADHLRPKYQIGANWDDYEYKGDARDITYWGQRFGAKAINFLAITTVLFAMIAVLKMVLSGGESGQRENLKKVAQWSTIALILAVFAYVIVKTVISMTYWG